MKRHRRHARRNPSGSTLLVAGLVAALAIGGVMYARNRMALALPSATSVPIRPGSIALTGIAIGSSIALALPTGGVWTAITVDGTPAVPTQPGTYSFTTQRAQGTITASWLDAAHTPQSTAISYGA